MCIEAVELVTREWNWVLRQRRCLGREGSGNTRHRRGLSREGGAHRVSWWRGALAGLVRLRSQQRSQRTPAARRNTRQRRCLGHEGSEQRSSANGRKKKPHNTARTAVEAQRKAEHEGLLCLPAPSGANKKSFPRGAPMQHLAPRRNPERSKGHFNPLDEHPDLTFSENAARVLTGSGRESCWTAEASSSSPAAPAHENARPRRFGRTAQQRQHTDHTPSARDSAQTTPSAHTKRPRTPRTRARSSSKLCEAVDRCCRRAGAGRRPCRPRLVANLRAVTGPALCPGAAVVRAASPATQSQARQLMQRTWAGMLIWGLGDTLATHSQTGRGGAGSAHIACQLFL